MQDLPVGLNNEAYCSFHYTPRCYDQWSSLMQLQDLKYLQVFSFALVSFPSTDFNDLQYNVSTNICISNCARSADETACCIEERDQV